MGLTDEQLNAARASHSVAVTAGAGTGKTHMLTERYLFHLTEHKFSPLEVVAVTYTDKAAAELRARIRRKVASELPGQDHILAEIEAAQISTIHSLAARICRDHFDLAEISPEFTILDDTAGPIWFEEHFDEALARLPLEIYEKIPYSKLRQAIRELLADPISARQALDHSPEEWPMLLERTQAEAVEKLCKDRGWCTVLEILSTNAGEVGDNMETNRRIALQAMGAIQGREIPLPHLDAILAIQLRGGSARRWINGGFDEVKGAIKRLRVIVEKCRSLLALSFNDADRQLAEELPLLRLAFELVDRRLSEAKRDAQVLDYADLEAHALKVLEYPEAREFYRARWKAFLVDEFQDTNVVQGRLLELLTEESILTVVGDEKQSIYGFRRADVTVFQQFRERILSGGGSKHALTMTFRSHALLTDAFNRVFNPVLAELHQPLEAFFASAPHTGPHLEAYVVTSDERVNKLPRQRVEARFLAARLKRMLDDGVLIRAKDSEHPRKILPGDIAVLSRTWDPLHIYEEALASEGIPAVHAGGGSLLDAREVKDAVALFRFLSDPLDDLALVTVLRSPFFAVSDKELLITSQSMEKGQPWWRIVYETEHEFLLRPKVVLDSLLTSRRTDSPGRLLQLADRLTGYTAVIANLPGATRREVDWRGFLDLIINWEREGISDVCTLSRRLKQLIEAGVQLPRPPIDTGNAVALMTIHAAKGLEWPVVVVPDLSRKPRDHAAVLEFDPGYGVALKAKGDNSDAVNPVLYTILEARRVAKETAEAKRVLYVALTRAGDKVLLSSAEEKGGSLDLLREGLAEANVALQPIVFSEEDALPHIPPDLESAEPPATVLADQVKLIPTDLPVTALTDYAACPQLFRFRHLEGHPGLAAGPAIGRRIGILTHLSLELGISEVEKLCKYDPTLPLQHVEEALTLARCFREDDVFEPLRKNVEAREKRVTLNYGHLNLQGTVDLVGDNFIVDFKSEQEIDPAHHRFQLWAYAQATGKDVAHIAYLRHRQVRTFGAEELFAIGQEAKELFSKLEQADYRPKPSQRNCGYCSYADLCADRYLESTDH
jgi:ATP-dependent helicase/nuclease subunit A